MPSHTALKPESLPQATALPQPVLQPQPAAHPQSAAQPHQTLQPQPLTLTPAARFSGYTPGTPVFRRLMIALFCSGMATFAQLYAPQAVLPQLASQMRLTEGAAGLVVSMGTIGLAAGVIPWATISDHIGRVRSMRGALIAATVLTIATSFAPTYEVLLTLRFLAGFAVGAVPALALAYLNAEMRHDHAAKAAGMFIAGNSIGGLAGRIVAGLVPPTFGWHMGVRAVSIMAGAATVLFILLIPAAHGTPPAKGKPVLPHRAGQNGGAGSRGIVENQSAPQVRHPFRANLRSPMQLRIFAQGFLIMGAFVAIYNYMGFRLQGTPFGVPAQVTSFIFVAYLSGTFSSMRAATLVVRFGRAHVLTGAAAAMAAGVLLTLVPQLWAQVAGLLLATMGFFGAQSIASGWASVGLPDARTQAGALYTLAYYGGGSLMGWLGGVLFTRFNWAGTVAMVTALAVTSALLAMNMGRVQSTGLVENMGHAGARAGQVSEKQSPKSQLGMVKNA